MFQSPILADEVVEEADSVEVVEQPTPEPTPVEQEPVVEQEEIEQPTEIEPSVQPEVSQPIIETTPAPSNQQAPTVPSKYTVEVTYDHQQYVMKSYEPTELSVVMNQLELSGTVTDVTVSDASLFSVQSVQGKWILSAHQPFKTNEWMRLVIDGKVIEVLVTDDALVSNQQELVDAIQAASGTSTITVDGTLILTDPIVIPEGKNIKLQNGTIKLADNWNHQNVAVITIEPNATLEIAGTILDGNGENVMLRGRFVYGSNHASGDFIHCLGTLILSDGAIQNVTSGQLSNSGGGLIVIDEGATFEMTGGEIKNNLLKQPPNAYYAGYEMGIIYLCTDSTFNLSNGSIHHNDIHWDTYNNMLDGIINMFKGSTFNMSGGAIEENGYRAVRIGGNYPDMDAENTVFTMTGGTIRKNEFDDVVGDGFLDEYGVDLEDFESFFEWGYLWSDHIGGGVEIANGTFILDGGTIEENSAILGGGVAINQTWGSKAVFHMNSGSIIGNIAHTGGGFYMTGHEEDIEAGNEDVRILGGKINDNQAVYQGGGLYTVRGFTIYLENALIHDNEATVMGGGIWGCPTSNVYIFLTNGGAVYDNVAWDDQTHEKTVSQVGDDITIVPQAEGHTFYIAPRALGGGKIYYYADGTVVGGNVYSGGLERYDLGRVALGSQRFDPNDPGDPYSGRYSDQQGRAIHSVLGDTEKELAIAAHTVEITGNKSQRGGGIGTNGNVVIGSDELRIDVEKVWEGDFDDDQKIATIQLIRILDGQEYELDTIELTKDNPKGYFTGLPEGTYKAVEKDVDPNEILVFYSEEEVTISEDVSQATIVVTNVKHVMNPPKGYPDETKDYKGKPQYGHVTFEADPESIGPDGQPAQIVRTTLVDEDGNEVDTVVVQGQGTYKLNEDGSITFTPEPEFVGHTTGVKVRGYDSNELYADTTYTPTVYVRVLYQDDDGTVIEAWQDSLDPEGYDDITIPDDPTRDGYTFLGWDQTFDQDGNIIRTARWELIPPEPTPTPTPQPQPKPEEKKEECPDCRPTPPACAGCMTTATPMPIVDFLQTMTLAGAGLLMILKGKKDSET